MCGICGKIDFNGKPIDSNLIKRMCQKMVHRGPDDEGIFIGPGSKVQSSKINVGLGHRRLSIIDLSEAGHQPMCNEDESVWIVYNGEIYNFLEIRERLEGKGHIFKSHTDTEVIIHAYEQWGYDCINHFRGMFAFGIWDDRKKRLCLARDRMGVKPLFYSFKNKNLVFASTLQSLIQDEDISKEIDMSAIDYYLTYSYIPAPYSIFKEIRKLPPAHFLIWEDGNISIHKYWDLDFSQKLVSGEREDVTEGILERLREAVKIRLISDVPLGVFLSGGIDSSAIVALTSGLMNEPVKTFSIGFEESAFNETQYAREIADLYHTEHYEFVVKPNILEILPILVENYGEPYADSSAIPTYYVSKMARQHVTVALTGDAGDENFAGYIRYVAFNHSESYKRYFRNLNRFLLSISERINYSLNQRHIFTRAHRFFQAMELPLIDRYIRLICHFDNLSKDNLYTEEFKKSIDYQNAYSYLSKIYESSSGIDTVDKILETDIKSYLPYDLLVKVDIASMANSLEARSPMLDHKFMEYVASIPSTLKLRGLKNKYIFKKALKDLIPRKILNRPKMGFGIPIGNWLRGDMKEFTLDHLMSESFLTRGYFKRNVVEDLLAEHMGCQVDHSYKIWSLLMLELWLRAFIDG